MKKERHNSLSATSRFGATNGQEVPLLIFPLPIKKDPGPRRTADSVGIVKHHPGKPDSKSPVDVN